MRKKLDIAVVDELKAQLNALPERKRIRPYDVISQLVAECEQTKERGYDLDDIQVMLRAKGVNLARNTVRTYLSRAQSRHTQARGPATSAATVNAARAPLQTPHSADSAPAAARPAAHATSAATTKSDTGATSTPPVTPAHAAPKPPAPASTAIPHQESRPEPANEATPPVLSGQWTMTPDLERL